MRFKFLLLLLISSYVAFSQSLTDNSLLWQISGNNLKQPSYLYGTMHVSAKIAFRLDDVFFNALDNAEYVALESDPNLWLDYYIDKQFSIDFYNYYRGGLYREANIKQPTINEVASLFGYDNQMINGVLYRTNDYSQNFEDETYLDMFIYQACKKFDKKFVPLEDIKESDSLMMHLREDDVKDIPDEWLKKKLKNENYGSLMENAYRERNINFIDSLQRGFYNKNYLKYMLYERNKIMARGIINTIQKGSTFTGVGAAHLPGENGVIQLLRDAGYTVTPLQSSKTAKGKKIKAKFEDKFVNTDLQETGTETNFINLKLPSKLYNMGTINNATFYGSPDLTNGSYVSLIRVSRFHYLPKADSISLKELENLFFEVIPGNITTKTPITNGNYAGYNIVSKLKNGDYQRYQIFETPLEIVIFKMGGKKEFVLSHSDAIFNTISFRNHTNNSLTTVTDAFKSFEITVPEEYAFYNYDKIGTKLIQAVNTQTGSVYTLEKVTHNEFNYIEEDPFELKHFQRRFYESLDVTPAYNPFTTLGKHSLLTSSGIVDSTTNTKVHVATTLHKGNFYLMSAFNATEKDATAFFTSLKIKQPTYEKPFEKVIDTALHFTTKTNAKVPEHTNLVIHPVYNNRNKKNEDTYKKYVKTSVYLNRNSEKINVELIKLNDYTTYANIDSLWNNEFEIDQDKTSFITSKPIRAIDKDSVYTETRILTDTLSSRAIYVKSFFKNGSLYRLKTMGDTISKPTTFVENFYANFKPADTVIGKSPFTDKAPLFFEKLRANDSIVKEIYNEVSFTEKHLDTLMKFVSNFNFTTEQQPIKFVFLSAIANAYNPKVKPYLKQLYYNSYQDPHIQEFILNQLAQNKNTKAITEILGLLEEDFPVDVKSFYFINHFTDSLALGSHLYPDILEYASIEEYKYPIFHSLADLLVHKKVKAKMYKNQVSQLLNEAKIMLKQDFTEEEPYLSASTKHLPMEDYITLLYPYKKQKNVAEFFEKIVQSKNPYFKISYHITQYLFGKEPNKEALVQYAKDPKHISILYRLLENQDALKLYPKEYFVQDSLLVGYTYRKISSRSYSSVKSCELIEKKKIANKLGTFDVYIYRVVSVYKSSGNETKAIKTYAVPENSTPMYEPEFSYSKTIYDHSDVDELIKHTLEQLEFKGRERVKVQNY
ncbi:TraB/GumN family protein [Neptunitalea lumnitzerae]|uniref:TraB/GumN family protein n=1 Tax=Neptunitalea lumnitzerae TaxID=2965509 RepID=A0ABQ5MFS2_9FLAO|nr:TraB/GumN family protein [Neptunitalea sp. Y10]GLB48242.1 hypothetical protein Y10_06100 [Neptunitalea sp. Y10]